MNITLTLEDSQLEELATLIAGKVVVGGGAAVEVVEPATDDDDDLLGGGDEAAEVTLEQVQDAIRATATRKVAKDKIKATLKKVGGAERAGDIKDTSKYQAVIDALGKLKA